MKNLKNKLQTQIHPQINDQVSEKSYIQVLNQVHGKIGVQTFWQVLINVQRGIDNE